VRAPRARHPWNWAATLDVVNCANHAADVTENGAYICPPQGGAYSHRRSCYFGLYENMEVNRISKFDAIVDLTPSDLSLPKDCEIVWNNLEEDDHRIFYTANEKLCEIIRKHQLPPNLRRRIFLLGHLFETSFRKDSDGGLYGTKIYFNVEEFRANDAQDLAQKLQNVVWSMVPLALNQHG
jgi:hypothetical protein